MNAPVLNLMIAGAMPSASTQMAHIPAAVRLVTVAMALTVQTLMNAQIIKQTSVPRMPCVRTVKGHMSAAVSRDTKGMVDDA